MHTYYSFSLNKKTQKFKQILVCKKQFQTRTMSRDKKFKKITYKNVNRSDINIDIYTVFSLYYKNRKSHFMTCRYKKLYILL